MLFAPTAEQTSFHPDVVLPACFLSRASELGLTDCSDTGSLAWGVNCFDPPGLFRPFTSLSCFRFVKSPPTHFGKDGHYAGTGNSAAALLTVTVLFTVWWQTRRCFVCCLLLAPQCISALLRRGVSLLIPLLSCCSGSSLSLSRRSWEGRTYRQSRILGRGASDTSSFRLPCSAQSGFSNAGQGCFQELVRQ